MQDLSFDAPSADAARQTHGKTSVFCLRAGVSRGEVSPVGLFVICTTATFLCTHVCCVCVWKEGGREGFSAVCCFLVLFFFTAGSLVTLLRTKEQLLHFTFKLL